MRTKNRKAAMEMSIGTIVVIVLSLSMLILGIILIKNIFEKGQGAIDLTDEQLNSEINELFGDDTELAIYPKLGIVTVKQNELEAVGIGIQNLFEGQAGATTFSYETVVSSTGNCEEDKEEILTWLVAGASDEDIPIRSGASIARKIRFKIPIGSSLCIPSFRVNVYAGEEPYAVGYFDIEIKPAKR